MKKKLKIPLNVGFLCFFFLLTLFIHFFHTEKNLQSSNECPACHFQNSTLTTQQIHFFHLPPLIHLGDLNTSERIDSSQQIVIEALSRSPPLI
ncbi:MAG: hypothetical protein JXB26_10630 [Candidatus Aminicenantes bacterium]|nr:hypothetical protein [Candidatus Aminicenantes bacterium]